MINLLAIVNLSNKIVIVIAIQLIIRKNIIKIKNNYQMNRHWRIILFINKSWRFKGNNVIRKIVIYHRYAKMMIFLKIIVNFTLIRKRIIFQMGV